MNTMTADDVNRTYGGTYIGMRDSSGSINAVCVDHAYDGDDDVRLSLRSEHNVSLDDDRLVYDFPEAGMVQVGSHCYWLERRAERQWHRGIRTRSFTRDLPRGVSIRTVAQSMYSPTHYELSSYGERTSTRLSSTFSIHADGCIMYRGTDVAMYSKESNTITCTNEHVVSLIEMEQWVNDATISTCK